MGKQEHVIAHSTGHGIPSPFTDSYLRRDTGVIAVTVACLVSLLLCFQRGRQPYSANSIPFVLRIKFSCSACARLHMLLRCRENQALGLTYS